MLYLSYIRPVTLTVYVITLTCYAVQTRSKDHEVFDLFYFSIIFQHLVFLAHIVNWSSRTFHINILEIHLFRNQIQV